jgi:fatty-acid peroxygenase
VELRLLGERAVCVGGPEGVRLFYEPGRFRRRDAIPRPLATTLFGKGAVHVHDGESHRHRKAMFLSLLDLAAAREIAAVADRLWQAAVDRWQGRERVVVFDEAVRVIGVAICGWTRLPLIAQNARRRVWDLEPIWVGSPDTRDWVAPAGLFHNPRRPASAGYPAVGARWRRRTTDSVG